MPRKKVYASCEITDQEVRLVVLEIFEGRFNVLRVERVSCDGVQNQKIIDEVGVVQAIQKACANAAEALGYKIEKVILAIPSVNVQRTTQKVHVQVEDGTRYIRLFHIQQGLNRAVQKKISDDVELVNVGYINYIIDGQSTQKMPISEPLEDFYMDVELIYADKETIYSYARCIEQANLEILDIYLDAYAIAQESAVQVKSLERPMIQLDLEANHCTLTLFNHGHLISSAILENGYRYFIQDIKDKYYLNDDVCFRLLQNVFATNVDPEQDQIIYIEQRQDTRIEIGSHELTASVISKIKQWIHEVNESCEPIVSQRTCEYLLTGKGANISILKSLVDAFNADAVIYSPSNIGARDGSFTCCMGMFYAYDDLNKIRHSNKISVNYNELGASIDSINHRSQAQEGGFTKRLKSMILSEEE